LVAAPTPGKKIDRAGLHYYWETCDEESSMEEGEDYLQFVRKVSETSQSEKNLKFRQTLDTAVLVLGTLSTISGVVVLLTSYLVFASLHAWIAAISGAILGASGLAVGRWTGGNISPFCAVGTIASLIDIVLLLYLNFS
jgi:VIT1/CCC1 family predicted Fe2+/Mn2+ transporter